MGVHERQQRILAELRLHGSLSAADFAARTGVSPMTVRRDLRELADAGRVRRVHGGAESVDTPAADTAPHGAVRHRPAARTVSDPRQPAAPLFTLGQVSPDPSYHFPPIVESAAQRARALGGRVVLGVSRYERERESHQIERLLAGGVDALLVTTTVADSFEVLARLAELTIPVVLVERSVEEAPIGDALESVRTDHAAGMVMAVKHLVELGHERLRVLAYDTPTTPFLRLGLDRAVRRLGLDARTDVIEVGETDSTGDALQGLLGRALADGVTALVVHSDHLAVDLTGVAVASGIQVPGDLSIVAYDDQVAELAEVPLTAVTRPSRDIGALAASMAFDRLASTDTVRASRHVTLRPQLSVRSSSGAPR
ncbi:LacI family DNA-binding transcriptional regulator [Brachybacterium sp. NPDC056505]|uniref:LacI family DNA-binding transcriptional regulator n=1 Tax=Brachybacterium sp. NPDC056505 TaxID=3345843 RepID=UPI00366CB3B1